MIRVQTALARFSGDSSVNGVMSPASVPIAVGVAVPVSAKVAAAMAFPEDYIPRNLPKKDQVKLAGNAVTPPVMTWIMGRVMQAIEAAQ